ncbi:MAG: DUF364 domain-containing protein [Actinomycetota bacterium]|nr:DUF364 domain-containing protein [Actinomycetota bacterium]
MIIDRFYKEGLADLKNTTNINLRIDNIIIGQSIYTMKGINRNFDDMNFCLLLLEDAYGFSYFQEKPDLKLVQQCVNKNISEIMSFPKIPTYFKVALVDAMCCLANKNNAVTYRYFIGNLRSKANQRANELIKDIPPKSKVLLIGAVTEIIEAAHNRDLCLSVTDLEYKKVNLKIDGTIIGDGINKTLEKLKHSDYAIVTGMTFSNNTADDIIKVCRENKTKLIFFMETGANFGNKLINYGAEKVLSEYFPFYDFCGNTKFVVFKK